ncbi:MAG TPA: DUF937 domain-containing protein [Propionibacteriaceae bacterium]|nr:DUF937 domain-containing protein [Propionibacteriaceae bacterium]
MSAVDDILTALPVGELAEQLGTDPDTIAQAVGPAVASILAGLTQNAQTPEGEQSLFGALSHHSQGALAGDSINLGDVDLDDGAKIVGHVFGDQTEGVIQTLGANTGAGQGLVAKLLPLLAPIVLSYLAKNMAGGKYGDLIGSVLGGGNAGAGSNVLGSILGQVLGGGNASSASAGSDVLGSILGQVLGGGGNTAGANNPFQSPEQQSGGGADILGTVLGSLFGKK